MGTDICLYRVLADKILAKIACNQLVQGDKLPSIRLFSQQQKVSINTVVSCYRLLEQLNVVSAKDKTGYIVLPKTPNIDMPLPFFSTKTVTLYTNTPFIKQLTLHPFERAHASPSLLPTASLNKCLTSVVRKHPLQVQSYGDVQGESVLRDSLANHFKQQGFIFQSDQLIINNGCLDSIKIALEITTSPGDCIAVLSPCFDGLLLLLALMKRKILEIPSCQAGVDLLQLEALMSAGEMSACLFTANHQNPLGRSLSLKQKKQLAELSNKLNIPIIEDDVYQELYFGQALPLPIKYFDQRGTIIWCSSISKTLASGYRIGWVLAGKYSNQFIHYRAVQSLGVNIPLQFAVSQFIEKRFYNRHLIRLRAKLAQQMQAYYDLLNSELSELNDFYISCPEGGLVLWVYIKNLDALALSTHAKSIGIVIRIGSEFSTTKLYTSYFRINFGYPLTNPLTKQLRSLCLLAKKQLNN